MVGENQVRNLFIAKAFPGHATIAALKAGTNGDLAALDSDGTAVVNDSEFQLFSKNNKGEVSKSDAINPANITSAKAIAYAAPVKKVVSVGAFSVQASELYSINVCVSGVGSLSVENEAIISGYYKSKSGDTAENIVDGLIVNLSKSFGRQQPSLSTVTAYTKADASSVNIKDNKWFKFEKGFTTQTLQVTTAPTADASATVTLDGVDVSVALLNADTADGAATKIAAAIDGVTGYSASASTDTVTVTTSTASSVLYAAGSTGTVVAQDGTASGAGVVIIEKSWEADYYVTNKKTRSKLDFKVVAGVVDDAVTDPTVTVETVASKGAGTGYDVRTMEAYLLGNRQDSYRGIGYPYNFDAEYDSVLSGTYNVLEIEYFDEGRDDPQKSKKQLTVAFAESAGTYTAINACIAELNKSLNSSSITVATLS